MPRLNVLVDFKTVPVHALLRRTKKMCSYWITFNDRIQKIKQSVAKIAVSAMVKGCTGPTPGGRKW